ncbi:DNA polymerase IV [Rubritalea profundi]|uniref:DNA polymerase IV n=1 Tax=Rubritalea profundi TaxID=1658618 RepID=A0A2S7U5Y5_9BACT|nr:DNA polymerase IV [Rubritalea profundi]PQJ29980.1 DNA polymerase IV [Rubritalea profundi]
MSEQEKQRKIIHIDMDCFYAAIEQRDFPELRGKPIGVGGSGRRGVLCTASYEARVFGVRAAMPGFMALERCPQLILVPTRFEVYQSVSAQIRAIFGRFTDLIEPLSLDEAYLDVSHWRSDASVIAREIRRQIFEETRLTASAGIGPNKLIAKIASDLDKPNGQWVVTANDVDGFMRTLPVAKLWGVGKKMQEKLSQHGIVTCGDMQKLDKIAMSRRYGRWGVELYELCRGGDAREVEVHRVRKSISKETTFSEDVVGDLALVPELRRLVAEVEQSYQARYTERTIKSVVVKLKFADFSRTTIEKVSSSVDEILAEALLIDGHARGGGKAVRLLGVGIRLADEEDETQLEMF